MAGAGCSANPAVRTEAAEPRVEIPTASAAETPEQFDCQAPEAGTRVLVTFTSHAELTIVDAAGAARSLTSLGSAEAAYEVSPLALVSGAPTRARILLRSHAIGAEQGPSLGAPGAWNTAVQKGWVQEGRPFEIELRGQKWCRADDAACSAEDEPQQKFVESVGTTVQMVGLAPEVVGALDGQRSDGNLSFTLPTAIAVRALPAGASPVAEQVQGGLPAVFMAQAEGQKETAAILKDRDGTESERMINVDWTSVTEVTVEQDCRPSRVTVDLQNSTPLLKDELPGRARTVAQHAWKIEPLE